VEWAVIVCCDAHVAMAALSRTVRRVRHTLIILNADGVLLLHARLLWFDAVRVAKQVYCV